MLMVFLQRWTENKPVYTVLYSLCTAGNILTTFKVQMVLILRLIAFVNLYTLRADICSSVIVTALKAKATCICYLKVPEI